MGCKVSIQVQPMPLQETLQVTKPAVATKLARQDSMDSSITIMLDEADFQGDL